jgi:hypothetical protein
VHHWVEECENKMKLNHTLADIVSYLFPSCYCISVSRINLLPPEARSRGEDKCCMAWH